MNNFLKKTVSITLFLLGCFSAFSQTNVAVYNGNPQPENKMFANHLIASFSHEEFGFEAKDKTSVISYFTKENQGEDIDIGKITDNDILLICNKLRDDYVINFMLYPNKNAQNVSVSLINIKTSSIEKTLTLTCANLKNSADIKETTDEIAAQFLLGNKIAEKRMKEEQALALKKEKEEKKLAKNKPKGTSNEEVSVAKPIADEPIIEVSNQKIETQKVEPANVPEEAKVFDEKEFTESDPIDSQLQNDSDEENVNVEDEKSKELEENDTEHEKLLSEFERRKQEQDAELTQLQTVPVPEINEPQIETPEPVKEIPEPVKETPVKVKEQAITPPKENKEKEVAVSNKNVLSIELIDYIIPLKDLVLHFNTLRTDFTSTAKQWELQLNPLIKKMNDDYSILSRIDKELTYGQNSKTEKKNLKAQMKSQEKIYKQSFDNLQKAGADIVKQLKELSNAEVKLTQQQFKESVPKIVPNLPPATIASQSSVSFSDRKIDLITLNYLKPANDLISWFQVTEHSFYKIIESHNQTIKKIIADDKALEQQLEPLHLKLSDYQRDPKVYKKEISGTKKEIGRIEKERNELSKLVVKDGKELSAQMNDYHKELQKVFSEKTKNVIETIETSFKNISNKY